MKNELRIVWLSNIVFEPYLQSGILHSFSDECIQPKLHFISYEEYPEKSDEFRNVDCVVVALNFEALYPDAVNDVIAGKNPAEEIEADLVLKIQSLYSGIRSQTNAPVIWFGFEDYCDKQDSVCGMIPVLSYLVDRINQKMLSLLSDCVCIDLKHLIAKIGIKDSYSIKGKYRWNAPYSKELIWSMADEVHKQYLIHMGKTKKCIVLDCDNVLWGGILSEDGMEGIRLGNSGLGASFQDFQRFLLTLYDRGVILTVCSKNNESDVINVFREHSGMVLKETHISYFCCNWNNKPDNIRTIADALNIDPASLVFIDDSRFELEAVKSLLPDVTTVQFDRETVYQELSCFNLRSEADTVNVDKRTETYRTNAKRAELKQQSATFEDYILSLNMNLDIHETRPHECARIAELTQRTNKCTNGRRYTSEQIKDKVASTEYDLYTICMSDKFSDLGIVGVIGICRGEIDLFSLSCRALGRKAEDTMIQYALGKGADTVWFCSTTKNETLPKLFGSYGLTVQE